MPNNEDLSDAPKSNVAQKSDFHPDSEYDNWTVRSFDVTTKYEDIPEWMKMFAESSTETQDFFKFERFDYKDLNEWQKMLLKLYRKDLHNIIRYYEDYRTCLVREIMDRERKDREKSSDVTNTRHEVCSVEVQKASPSTQSRLQRNNIMSFHRRSFELSGGSSSTTSTSSSTASPSNSLLTTPHSNALIPSPEPIKFKRFGHRSSNSSRNKVVSKEDLHTAIGSSPPQTTSDNGLVSEDKEGDAGIVIATEEGFESPKLERVIRSKRKTRGRLNTDLFSNLDIVQLPQHHDFPSPQHVRSASSRYSSQVNDFPSPSLARSASDRPSRHSVHVSLLHGSGRSSVYRDSASSTNTLDSRESLFSRDSSKRGSGRAITSPKLKGRSEPRADAVTVIPDKKEKKLSKLLSRATSFGRKDKSKSRGKKSRGDSLEKSLDSLDATRKSRKDDFLAGKETVV